MTKLDKTSSKQGVGGNFLNLLFGKRKIKTGPSVPEDTRIYAIGDIHGQLNLLEELHEKIVADAQNAKHKKIIQIFLGDYVDRGLESKGVVDWLLQPPPNDWERVCLKGNHETMILNFLEKPEMVRNWQQYGGLETLHSYGIELVNLREEDAPKILLAEFVEKFPDAHHAFFSKLALFVEFGDYFFVHAGVRPGVSLQAQKEQDLLWIGDEFLASQMDFGKVIVHGHTPTKQPELLSNRINIDTGAYMTGRLTCLVLEGEEQRFL